MAYFELRVTTEGDVPYLSGAEASSVQRLINWLRGSLGGAGRGTRTGTWATSGVAASGTYTVSSASGTITATINGQACSFSSTGVDATDAAGLAAAIEAKAELATVVSATSALGVVTVTSLILGPAGNYITTAATGTGLTADQTRLASGSETTESFSF